MEMVELTQKEIRILLSLLDSIDFDCGMNFSELVHLHSKLTSAQTF